LGQQSSVLLIDRRRRLDLRLKGGLRDSFEGDIRRAL
jgi:hypothetical protein